MNNDKTRFLQIIRLVEKETLHLQQIIQRFFESKDVITLAWLQKKLETAEGIDQLESFSAKFSRLQDTLRDKLLPLFLKLSAEPVGTAIENLYRAEKLGLIMDTVQWLSARQLRNFLIHEYIEDLTVLLESLVQAREMSFILINTADAIKVYAQKIGIDKVDDNQ
jgi:uncharacterized protein with HEPN domain